MAILAPHIIEITGQQLVVVGLWVVGVVIIELGALVKAIFPEQRGGELRGIVDVPIPRE